MKKIRWGILGCGGIANKFAEALQINEDAVLQAAAARDKARAAEFANKWNFKSSYGSYKELVSDPDVDIIYVATPHSYHFAHTKLCLEAGKHVLCEKPFTINAKQLKILIDIASNRNLFLMEALWTRFMPGIIKTKKLIDEGIIGKVITAEADFGMNFPFDPEHRVYNPFLAGGALLDIGIYPLFLSLYLFGKPKKLKAHSILDDNKIDLTTSIITESNSGTVSHLNSTTQANTHVKARIFGTNGNIEFDKWWFTPVNITLRTGDKEEVMEFSPIVNGYEYEAMESVKCLQENKNESDIMPLYFSMMLMEQMDEIRKITGITYPEEIESTAKPYGWNEL
ncbi:MAG: Gfo/Idh/MocA family oxidoreductase [Bacteroidales bacterium]|nr:Gfo/Idh/MocA family oxidoreductase [Bacteroidales bacterium]